MTSAPLPVRRPARWWTELQALGLPMGTYWVAVLVSMTLFTAVIAVFKGLADPVGMGVMAGLWGATLLGLVTGQIAALLRFRTWLILLVGTVIWSALFAAMVVLLGAGFEVFGLPLMLVWFFFPFFLLCGVWSLRVNRGILAAWAPTVYLSMSILLITEETGRVSKWFAGQKWAIWDLTTAPVLLLGVGMLIAFLWARERHRLHRWMFAPGGPDQPMTTWKRSQGLRWVLPGCGTGVVLAVLAVVLTVDSGVVAPYLWRSAPDEQGEPRPEPEPQPEPQDRPDSGCEREAKPPPNGEGPPGQPMTPEQIQRAAQRAGVAVLFLALLVLLSVLLLLVFGPPLRRTLLLHHLRRPFWPIPPTQSVQYSWRVVEIALGDLGVERRPGDTATSLARRAVDQLPPDLHVEDLEVCAATVDRVIYGLGLDPQDADRARRTAQMAYQAVWSDLSELRRFYAIYRWL